MLQPLKSRIYRTLRRSESIFKTDMVYLAKGWSWLTGGQLLNVFLSLLLSLTFANLVTQDVYGLYKYILATATFLGSFSLTGLNSSTIASVAKGFDGTFKKAFFLSLKSNIAAASATILTSVYYFFNSNNTLSIGILIAGLGIPLVRSFSMYGSYLTGRKLFKRKSLYGLIASGSSTITLILAIIFITKENVIILLSFYFFTLTTINAFFLKKTFKIVSNGEEEPRSIKYGIHTSIINLLGTAANNLDSILVFQYLGAAQLAIYSFAVLVPESIKDIIKNIPALAVPKIAMRPISETKKYVYKKSGAILLLTIPIVIVYIALAPYLYEILFPAYTASVPFSQAFALTILLSGGLSGATLQAYHATKATYLLSGVSHISRIVLMVALFPLYGIWGIIAGRIISKYITSMTSYILVKRL